MSNCDGEEALRFLSFDTLKVRSFLLLPLSLCVCICLCVYVCVTSLSLSSTVCGRGSVSRVLIPYVAGGRCVYVASQGHTLQQGLYGLSRAERDGQPGGREYVWLPCPILHGAQGTSPSYALIAASLNIYSTYIFCLLIMARAGQLYRLHESVYLIRGVPGARQQKRQVSQAPGQPRGTRWGRRALFYHPRERLHAESAAIAILQRTSGYVLLYCVSLFFWVVCACVHGYQSSCVQFRLTCVAASVKFHEFLLEDRIVPTYHDGWMSLSPATLRVPLQSDEVCVSCVSFCVSVC